MDGKIRKNHRSTIDVHNQTEVTHAPSDYSSTANNGKYLLFVCLMSSNIIIWCYCDVNLTIS